MNDLILKTIDDDIELAKIFAHYWMSMATTGACKNQRIYKGTEGPEFTDDEKVSSAMETASRHIERMSALIEKKRTLLYADEVSNGG